jgi:hypothetical protein
MSKNRVYRGHTVININLKPIYGLFFFDDFSIFGGVSYTKLGTGHLLPPTVSEANRGRTDYY